MQQYTNDLELNAIANNELNTNTQDDALWRKAMALMGSNEEKARKKYIKLRILDLQKNGKTGTSQNNHKIKDTKSSNEKTDKSKDTAEPKKDSSSNVFQLEQKHNKKTFNSSWIWWIALAGIVIGLIVQSNIGSKSSKNISNTSYSKSSDYSSDYTSPKKDNYYEKKPSSSTYTLDKNEVLYCEAEMIRLDIVKNKIDKYSQYEIDKYNTLSDDHNARCVNKKYYKNDMYTVNKLIKDRRSQIEQEGLARFQTTKKKNLKNTFNKDNNYDIKTSSTGSKVGSCKVTIFNDGSIGAEINGKFRQWKHMSSREKGRCERALNQEQSKNKSKSKAKTYAEKKGTQKYPLTINTVPSNARVQIMNIKPKYYDGIRLVQGKYKIRVSKKGYERVDGIADPSEFSSYNVVLTKKYKTSASSTHVRQNTKRMTKKEQDNYSQCIRGDFPTLCKHSWLTSAQKKEVRRAEKKHNYIQCIRGDFPTLCKHSWLTSSQAKKVKEAERRVNLNRGY